MSRSARIGLEGGAPLRRGRAFQAASDAGIGVLVALCACRGTEPAGVGGRVIIDSPVERSMSVNAAFQPAFDALQAAVRDGEDDVARRILAGIRARRPGPDLLEYAEGFERILDGRALMRDLHLALETEAIEGAPADLRLVLVASHPRAADVTLRLPAGMLRRTRTTLDARGDESRSLSTEATTALGDLHVPAGETVRVPLCSFEVPTAGALAVRERWALSTRAGIFLLGDEELPAQDPAVAPCETTRLAPFLPTAEVEPEELVSYLRRDEVYLPALLERAVRIPTARRDEALDLLEPVVAELAATRPERIAEAAPALRWLTRSVDEGHDPAAWAAWFAARGSAREAAAERGALDLPEDLNAR